MREVAYDYDQSIYFIMKDEGQDLIKFCFSCQGSKQILINGGEAMLKDLYSGTMKLLFISIRAYTLWSRSKPRL